MRTLRLVVLVGFALQLSAPVWAHHAFSAEFDVDRPLQLNGKLVKWEMINPHSWFHIDVEDEDGGVTTWMIEGGSPNQLIRLGVTKNTLAIGTELVVDGYQAKDGTNKGVGRDFTLADGKRLFLGGSAAEIETGR
ncbi:MAG: DUF6152 family protein [Acidobacteria bacterium]|nr:DUF6152 family protein [Acidobacteriota bacterium]